MVLGSRIRRTPVGPPSADGTGMTGGPNAKTDAQEAHYRETLKVEASVIELLSKMQITLGDPRVQLYTSAVLTAPINLPLPFPSTLLEDGTHGGKRRRGVSVSVAPAPATLISPAPALSMHTSSPLPLFPLPSSLDFPSYSSDPLFPSTVPEHKNPLAGTFDGLGVLVNDFDLVEDNNMPFSRPGLKMEDWWFGLTSHDRMDIAQFLADGSGLLPDIVLKGCMEKFHLDYLQCTWAREFCASEEKGNQENPSLLPVCAPIKHVVDMSCSVHAFPLVGGLVDDWSNSNSADVFAFEPLPFDDYNLDHFNYDDDMLSMRSPSLASEVPLGPTPYQNTLPSQFAHSPLPNKHANDFSMLSFAPFNNFSDPSLVQMGGVCSSSLPNARYAQPPGLTSVKSTGDNDKTRSAPNVSQPSTNGKAAHKKSVSAPAEPPEETLSARQQFAREHEQELLNTKHPDHKQSLFDWCMMDDSPAEVEQAKRRSRPNFGKEAYEPLRTWFISKIPDGGTKPTKEEKRMLEAATGLKTEQIVRWASNNNRRVYLPNKELLDKLASQRDGELDPSRRQTIEANMYRTMFKLKEDKNCADN